MKMATHFGERVNSAFSQSQVPQMEPGLGSCWAAIRQTAAFFPQSYISLSANVASFFSFQPGKNREKSSPLGSLFILRWQLFSTYISEMDLLRFLVFEFSLSPLAFISISQSSATFTQERVLSSHFIKSILYPPGVIHMSGPSQGCDVWK